MASVLVSILLMITMSSGDVSDGPEWVTDSWIDFASHIVAGEAAESDDARLITACTMIHDVERGWNPWGLRGRWYGWKRAGGDDRAAVIQALYSDACDSLPVCLYLGNARDVRYWRRIGMVRSTDVIIEYVDTHNRMSACVSRESSQ